MKKVLIGLVVVVVLIAGFIFYTLSNLDKIVKTAIETAGSEAVGSAVLVGAVEIDLFSGTASIHNFSIANPEGFSNQPLMSFAELSVGLDLNNISGTAIGIRSIVAREPYILYEMRGDSSNLDAMNENIAGDNSSATTEPSAGSAESPVLTVDSILIEDIQASLESDLLGEPLDVNLGDINLDNLHGTPEEIASQIIKPVLAQLSTTAANSLLTAVAGMDLEDLEAAAEARVDEEMENLEERAREEIDEALGEGVRKGLESLLK